MTVTKMNAGEYLVQAESAIYTVSHGYKNAQGNPWSVYVRAAGKYCLLHEAWSKREALAWITEQSTTE